MLQLLAKVQARPFLVCGKAKTTAGRNNDHCDRDCTASAANQLHDATSRLTATTSIRVRYSHAFAGNQSTSVGLDGVIVDTESKFPRERNQ
jgi:hypothetical protein